MYRLQTKEQREQSRAAQFESLQQSGYVKTEYKNLVVFHHPEKLLLKSFWGTAAKHTDFYKYPTAERLTAKVEELKRSADSREKWDEEKKQRKALEGAKITLATLKKFIKDNAGNLYLKVESAFDGMTDCVESVKDEFSPRTIENDNKHNLGVSGLWLVGSSRDSFSVYNDDSFCGIRVWNSCGSCIVAKKKEAQKEKPTQQKREAATPGKVQLIEYSEKSFAVIGEFSAHYDQLISLGGKYNKFLKCGRGIIFSNSKLNAVKNYFLSQKTQEQQPEESTTQQEQTGRPLPELNEEQKNAEAVKINEADILPTPENNTLNLDYFKILWHEGRHIPGATLENTILTTWEDVQRTFLILWQVNEKGSGGGYTKVKCEIKLQGQEPEICRIDITDKVNNGDFNPSAQHIADYISELIGETEPEQNETMQALRY